MNPLIFLAPLLVGGADPVPADDDVKAGWVAFGVFIALAVAVVLLGISLTRHLRKARDNAEHGAFDPSDKPRPHAS
jgi:hypothetical protein